MAAGLTVVAAGDDERATQPIAVPADALIAKDAADRLAERIGFTEPERAEISLVVRELATNILRHAGEGEITLVATPEGIEIIACDRGPGIDDIDRAVTDGVSKDGGLGYGLGTVNRAMDELLIASARGEGTTVTTRRRLRSAMVTSGRSPLDVGVASTPKPGYSDNGDAFALRSWDHQTLVGVIDGLGHGQPAHAAALAARRYVESHADLRLDAVFRGTAIACRGTRGVVMALARFDWVEQTLEFGSIGNIETRVFGVAAPLNFIVRRGVVGHNAPDPKITTHHWPEGATLVLHSDGIPAHWGQFDLQALADQPAATMAAAILRRLNRHSDDATVVVVKWAPP